MFDEQYLACHDRIPKVHIFFAICFLFSSGSGNFNGTKLSVCTCSQTGVQVLHGISALVKMEQTEPRIRAFLKKVPGDRVAGCLVIVSCLADGNCALCSKEAAKKEYST